MRSQLTTALLLTAGLAIAPLATAETIVLTNGDVINAEKVSETDSTMIIKHPAFGEVTLQKDQIKAVYADADAMKAAQVEAEALKKAQAKKEAYENDEGIFWGSGFLKGWNRKIRLGVNGADGNSQNVNFRASFHGDYEDTDDRWLFDMVYRAARSNGATSDNQFYAALTKDWLLPDHDYFYFANGRYDWDQFEDWDSRLSGFAGMGYQFLDDETWNVRARAGAGGNQTFGGSTQSDEFTPEALIGVEADYVIGEDHELAFTNYTYPSLDEGGEFRNVTVLGYVIGLDNDMDLVLGIANEYDSAAPSNVKKNDFTYFATLGWSF